MFVLYRKVYILKNNILLLVMLVLRSQAGPFTLSFFVINQATPSGVSVIVPFSSCWTWYVTSFPFGIVTLSGPNNTRSDSGSPEGLRVICPLTIVLNGCWVSFLMSIHLGAARSGLVVGVWDPDYSLYRSKD